MISRALYLRGIKESVKMLAVFAAVLTLYYSMIIAMYDPKLNEQLEELVKSMPELMAAFGMSAGATTLTGFLASYLYGFLAVVFPMVFAILSANRLISRHTDKGSMVYLLAAPISRKKVVVTQAAVLLSGIFALILYVTLLTVIVSSAMFPGELNIGRFLLINLNAFALQFFIAGICFIASVFFSDSKKCTAVGAGVPFLFYLVQMLSNVSDRISSIRYVTFFTLFNPAKLAAGEAVYFFGAAVLIIGAAAFFIGAFTIFNRKDLHI